MFSFGIIILNCENKLYTKALNGASVYALK